jgi:hypothetical protein
MISAGKTREETANRLAQNSIFVGSMMYSLKSQNSCMEGLILFNHENFLQVKKMFSTSDGSGDQTGESISTSPLCAQASAQIDTSQRERNNISRAVRHLPDCVL